MLIKLKDALATKVSNERIRNEIDLMFAGKNPHNAIQILYELNILQHSLKIPPTCKGSILQRLIKNRIIRS